MQDSAEQRRLSAATGSEQYGDEDSIEPGNGVTIGDVRKAVLKPVSSALNQLPVCIYETYATVLILIDMEPRRVENALIYRSSFIDIFYVHVVLATLATIILTTLTLLYSNASKFAAGRRVLDFLKENDSIGTFDRENLAALRYGVTYRSYDMLMIFFQPYNIVRNIFAFALDGTRLNGSLIIVLCLDTIVSIILVLGSATKLKLLSADDTLAFDKFKDSGRWHPAMADNFYTCECGFVKGEPMVAIIAKKSGSSLMNRTLVKMSYFVVVAATGNLRSEYELPVIFRICLVVLPFSLASIYSAALFVTVSAVLATYLPRE